MASKTSDIFCNNVTFGGVLESDGLSMTFSDDDGSIGVDGFMLQSASIQYSRPQSQLHELGPERRTFFVVGRAQGQMQISSLVGPRALIGLFFSKFGNPCNVPRNTIVTNSRVGAGAIAQRCGDETGLCTGVSVRDVFEFCLANATAKSWAAQQPAINQGITLSFARHYQDSQNGDARRV